jgi:tripartite-type tricarboxylate transporter receptor subunit TctC
MRLVVFPGGAPSTVAVLGGHASVLISTVVPILQHVASGKLRALAVTSAVRSSLIKDVPTMMEAGQKDFDMSGAMGVFAPAATPRPTMERFNAEVTRALALPEVRDGMLRDGFVVSPIGLAEFDAFMRAKVKQIQMIAKAANLKTDY